MGFRKEHPKQDQNIFHFIVKSSAIEQNYIMKKWCLWQTKVDIIIRIILSSKKYRPIDMDLDESMNAII